METGAVGRHAQVFGDIRRPRELATGEALRHATAQRMCERLEHRCGHDDFFAVPTRLRHPSIISTPKIAQEILRNCSCAFIVSVMTIAAVPHRLTRNTRYIAWLISDTAKGLAGALFSFAIPLIVLFVTNDPAQAGIIGAIGMGVRTATTLLGGVLADRHRRITMMVLGSAIGTVLAAGFMLLALGDALTFATLLAIDVLLAARAGLFDVAGESALKEIVPDDAMGRAQAANQGRDAVLQLAGGPLGGALLAVGGWLIGAAMAVCHVIAMVTAWILQRSAAPGAIPSVAEASESAPATAAPAVGRPNARREIAE